jgi:hypothetical protein
MSGAKFTPGPWVVKKDDWGIRVQCKESVSGLSFAFTPICEIYQEEDTGGIDDANLIAAAPDMYEALEAISGSGCFCSLSIGNPMTGGNHSDACKKATAALKKARGET